MKAEQVEGICNNLPPLFKSVIKLKILEVPPGSTEYEDGEALVFWVADLLTAVQIVSESELRLIIEEYAKAITSYGEQLSAAVNVPPDTPGEIQLPAAKLGFLDRRYVCLDGKPGFLDIKTGEFVRQLKTMPLEMLAFNLAALFIRNKQQVSQIKFEQKGRP